MCFILTSRKHSHFTLVYFHSLHFTSVLFTSLKFISVLFTSLQPNFYTVGSQRGKTLHTTHLIQRPCCQRGSPCQDPAGNRTTRIPPDHRKEMQTAVVRSCLPFNRSGQTHLARHSERGKKTRQTEEEVGRQYTEMDWPGVRQVPEGSGEQGEMEESGCEITCGAPTTLAVKG